MLATRHRSLFATAAMLSLVGLLLVPWTPTSADQRILGSPVQPVVLEISVEPLVEPIGGGETFQPAVTALMTDGGSVPVDPADEDLVVRILDGEEIVSVSEGSGVLALTRGSALFRILHYGRSRSPASAQVLSDPKILEALREIQRTSSEKWQGKEASRLLERIEAESAAN